jgi:hypothetical protein
MMQIISGWDDDRPDPQTGAAGDLTSPRQHQTIALE